MLTQHSAVIDLNHEGDLWTWPREFVHRLLAVFNAIAVELTDRLEVPSNDFSTTIRAALSEERQASCRRCHA